MAKSFEIWYISIAFVEVNILSIFSLRNVSHKLAPLRLEIARQSNDYTLNVTAHHPPPPLITPPPPPSPRFFHDIPSCGREKRFMNGTPLTL